MILSNPISHLTRLTSAGVFASLLALSAHAQINLTKTINPAPDISVNGAVNTTQQFVFTVGEVGGGGLINDVDIAIRFTKSRGVLATAFNEIGFTLSYGAINTALIVGDSSLINNQATFGVGLFASTFSGTIVFDDESANSLGSAPAAGTFRPVGSLAAFDGALLTAGSAWTLTISDTSAIGSAVVFDRATLNVNITPVPEPSTYGLLGVVSLIGIVAWRRFRKNAA